MIMLLWMGAIASSVCGEIEFFVNGSFFDEPYLCTVDVVRSRG